MFLSNTSPYCIWTYDYFQNNITVRAIQLLAVPGYCGNVVTYDSGTIFVSNNVTINPIAGISTSLTPYSINFTFAYSLSFLPIPAPVFPSGLSGAWGFPVNISLYLDEAFSVPVPTTTVIYAFDTIYLAVFAPNFAPNFANVLVVRVDQCVASSTDNRTYNVPLVSGGRAVSGDVTVLWNGNATESRISINTLRFKGQSSLYIFCDVRLCLKSDNCSQCNLSIPGSGTKEMVVAVNLTDSGCYSGGFPMCRDCAGSCSSGPCYCPSGLQCIPTTECTTQTNECCPSGLYWDSNNTCCTGTPQCHPPCAADEVCNAGSCECSQTIYQNQTISDMKPPLVCSDFAVTVSFSKCLLTYLNYDLTSMRINNNNSSPDCNLAYDGVQNGINVRSIETKIIPGYCGNVVTYNSTVYIISNNVTIDPTESNLTVGQNPLSMNFTCEYGLTSASVSPPAHPSGISGTGSFDLVMVAYKDADNTIFIQDRDVVQAGSDIYLAVYAPHTDGEIFLLRVDQCVASSTNNRTNSVPLVSGGCAVTGNVSVVVYGNGKSLETRIRVNTLNFRRQSSLYIYCDVRICAGTSDCSQCDSSTVSSLEVKQVVHLEDVACYNGTGVICEAADCAGDCVAGIGCICADYTTSCIPTTGCPLQTNDCCPSGYQYYTDMACCTDAPICNPSCVLDEICNAGTCECDKYYYMYKTISDLKPSLDCNYYGAVTVSFNKCLLTYLYYDSTSLSLSDSSPYCNWTYDDFQNNIAVTSTQTRADVGFCGNVVTYDSSTIFVSNNVTINPIGGVSTSLTPYSINFTCAYSLSLLPIPAPVFPSGLSGAWGFPVTMALYSEATFSIPVQTETVINAGDTIYLAVFAPNFAPNFANVLVVRVDQCVASSTDNRTYNVPLVSGGCAVSGGVTVLQNGYGIESRISINTLKFNGQSSLYIFCDVRLCTSNCSQCNVSIPDSGTKEMVVAVNLTDLPICNPPCASDEICDYGMCQCNYDLYIDKPLADVMPSVDCVSDTGVITLSISKCLLVSLNYDYKTLRINHNSSVECSSTYTDTVNGTTRGVIQDKIGLSSCGNVITVNTTTFVIQNSLTIDPVVLYTSSPWLKTIWRNFSCAYSLSRPPITLGTNSLPLRVAAYSDPQYAMAILETDTVHTGDIIYLVLTTSASLGIDSTLRVEQCVASSTDNRTDSVPLVSGGCADAGVVITENGISLQSRLSINTVNFIGYRSLYIFCNVRLCIGTSYCSQCSVSSPSLDMALMQTIHFKEAACYSGNKTMCGSCGGSCDMGSCFCADGLESCVPTAECLSQTNGCCPSGYYYDANHTCCSDAVFCNPACAADEICTYGTCQCEKSFYRGFTVADMKPSVQCDVDIATLSVSKCLLTYLGYDFSSLHFNDPLSLVCNNSYETTENDRKMEYLEGRLIPGWCNNVFTYDNGTFFTTNSLNINGLPGNGSLIAVEPYSMSFSCPYNPFLGFVTAIVELTGPFGEGPYAVIMAAYKDPKYTTMLSLKESVSYSDVIYLSFVGLSVNVSWLVVRVDQCVASTSDNRTNAILLLSGGVPVTDKLEVLENEVSLQSRMMVNTSSFDGYDAVFLFCDVELCNRDYHCCQCDTTSPLPTQVKLMVPFKGRYFQVTPVWIFL